MIDRNILIVAETLYSQLNDPGWVAVDCRFNLLEPTAGQAMYDEGHIPGAVFLDLDRDLAGPVTAGTGRHPLPDVSAITARLEELGIGNSSKIVVYDANSGALAARAWWVLHWLGHEEAYLLDGGFERWCSLGYSIDAGQVVPPRAEFSPNVRNDLILTTEEVACSDDASVLRLLDARDAIRFRGEKEPIDPVAGHVPGATNAPFSEFLHADGTWLPVAERRELLLQALNGDDQTAWSVMCGSGVTACHLAISGIEAGLPEPRVYVGSWSEWIRDERRPVGLGEPADLA